MRLRIPEPWSAPQRGVLIGLVVLLSLCVAVRYWLNPMYVSEPQPLVPAKASELADRIDPNVATADELAALPLIGERRASDIISYRQRYVVDHPGRIAFEKPEDLLAIRGIGASILAQIRPYLIFPKDRPTTGP
jgi:DNA uptake protein ComE-like DNA-binding protein